MGRGDLAGDIVDERIEVDVYGLGLHPTDAGELEQVLDELLHVAGARVHAIEVVTAFGRERAGMVGPQVLEIAEQRDDRALQIVRDAVDQRLELGVGGFDRLA